jgi:hypothetical protein
MPEEFLYKDYIVSIEKINEGYTYSITNKNGKVITNSTGVFPFPTEAEMQAKLYINRITLKNDGFIVT